MSIEPSPTRRAILRGFGTTLALPWLEALAPRGARGPTGTTGPSGPTGPTRLAWLYVPNGVHMPDWLPAQEGPLANLPWILEPLAPLRGELSVLAGLTHDKGRANGDGPGDHARAAATWLTGLQPLKTDGRVELGVSADQVASRTLGRATRFPSLVLGCEPGRTAGECDSGYACAYSGHVSWEGPRTPAGKATDPRAVFDRLFRGGEDAESQAARRTRLEARRSVLDFVSEDARALRGRLSSADRAELEEYFDGLRELERRLEGAFPERVEEVPDAARPAGEPADYAQHARLLLDLLLLAFRSDVTRVATFMLADEGSNRSYPALGVREGHHSLSHHENDAAKQDQIRRINRFHVELLAHFLQALAERREGERSLLDASLVVYGSGLADGNRHAHDDLPVVLAGRGNGALRQGLFRRYPAETPMMNLHLALLERAGLSPAPLGDGTGALEL